MNEECLQRGHNLTEEVHKDGRVHVECKRCKEVWNMPIFTEKTNDRKSPNS